MWSLKLLSALISLNQNTTMRHNQNTMQNQVGEQILLITDPIEMTKSTETGVWMQDVSWTTFNVGRHTVCIVDKTRVKCFKLCVGASRTNCYVDPWNTCRSFRSYRSSCHRLADVHTWMTLPLSHRRPSPCNQLGHGRVEVSARTPRRCRPDVLVVTCRRHALQRLRASQAALQLHG